jgi:hypothetical protein
MGDLGLRPGLDGEDVDECSDTEHADASLGIELVGRFDPEG